MDQAGQYPDEFWYEQLISKDSAARLLNLDQKTSIIKECMQEAKRQKLRIEEQLNSQPPQEILERLGFQVENEDTELMPGFLYMGLLVPQEHKVLLNETVIQLGERWLAGHFAAEDPIRERFRDIILYHELYHAIEEQNPDIYTRNVSVRRPVLAVFSRNVVVEAASEVGAVHFSKLASGVDFCPYIYTQYLLRAVKQDAEV